MPASSGYPIQIYFAHMQCNASISVSAFLVESLQIQQATIKLYSGSARVNLLP